MKRDILTGVYYTMGDLACAEGAIAAGCRFFAGYPITPATEVSEQMARRLPEVGGVYLQMEDEIASMAAVIGASYAGTKAMTATSGPGFSLMQENIGLAAMTEAPCVIVDVMRGGPSTGQPTKTSQQDMMQAKWGSHGDYEIVALAPSSVQEMFDLTIDAFNLSEQYRCPVIVLADQIVGHLRERLEIPEPERIKVVNRKRPNGSKKDYMPFRADPDLIPPMAFLGEGYRFYITGLTHDEAGRLATDSPEAQEELVRRINDKIRSNQAKICRTEQHHIEDAKVCVVAYGSVYRSALSAVRKARAEGIRAGLLRPITIWPFPDEAVIEATSRAKSVVVPEMNYGQIVREVQRCTQRDKVHFYPKLGDALHTPEEIYTMIRSLN